MANEVPDAVVLTTICANRLRRTRLRPIRWSASDCEDILDSARLLVGQMLSSPGVAARAISSLPWRAWPYRDGRVRTGSRCQGQAFCRLRRGRTALPTARLRSAISLGAAPSTASSMRPKWRSGMPNARALSSLCWWTRWRRPIHLRAIRRRSRSLSRHGGASFVHGLENLIARSGPQWRLAGASR